LSALLLDRPGRGALASLASRDTSALTLVDVLRDERWAEFADRHPSALAFHQPSWIAALASGIGGEPWCPALLDGQLQIAAAWPFMLMRSRLTGTRMVCLPYCHRTGPLVDTAEQAAILMSMVLEKAESMRASWIEVRGWPSGVPVPAELESSSQFTRHVTDLTAGRDAAWAGLEHRSTRYSIRKAERNGVTVRRAGSFEDTRIFYHLYETQRRSQALLPQPWRFIETIWRTIVDPGNGFVLIAEHKKTPVAAVLAIGHRGNLVATHSGGSGEARRLLATPLLMWKSMELACELGYQTYDFGRCHATDAGLLRFKSQLGATQLDLPYYYYPEKRGFNTGDKSRLFTAGLKLTTCVASDRMLEMLGSVLYKHLG